MTILRISLESPAGLRFEVGVTSIRPEVTAGSTLSKRTRLSKSGMLNILD